ncbi:lysylphosphatidylglycerol synthase domain-containing protein [Xanthobacter sp. KR7-65]|uniref:lysylphosphatidylglycerol synthase domain-containing protein n=1 Tax=Xanthobacter sp. KR7-65 TaxID=3156612 RepID=UPI0032B33F3D
MTAAEAGRIPRRRSLGARAKAVLSSRAFQICAFAAAVALGGFLLYRALRDYSPAELLAAIMAVPAGGLAFAALFAAASYLTLTLFDYLALRCAGKPLRWRQAALASFSSLSVGHTIGFAGLSSGAIRYRFYARWGLSAAEVAQVVLYCGLTVAMGLCTLCGIMLLVDPATGSRMIGLPPGAVLALAGAALAIPALYLALAAIPERNLRRQVWRLRRPPLWIAAAQVTVGTVNFAFVAACLHQVLRHLGDTGYPAVAAAYVAANAATLVSHVPGGLGVVETVVQHLIPGAALIGPLLVFRIVYFLTPLALGLSVFAVSEAVFRHAKGRTDQPQV